MISVKQHIIFNKSLLTKSDFVFVVICRENDVSNLKFFKAVLKALWPNG